LDYIKNFREVSVDTVYRTIDEVRAAQKEAWAAKIAVDKEIAELKVQQYIDRSKSVDWNEEEKKRRLTALKVKSTKCNTAYNKASAPFWDAVVAYIMNQYDLAPDIAQEVLSRAYKDSNSAGYREVLSYAKKYAEFADAILALDRG
jgi:hypothetical protein